MSKVKTQEIGRIESNGALIKSEPLDATLAMFERALINPEISVEKINSLFDLHVKMMEKKDELEFNAAMNRVQTALPSVAPDLFNNQTKSRYPSYNAMDKRVRPVYSKEGFALSFNTAESPLADHVRSICYVTRGAYTRTYQIDMPCDGKGAKGGDVMTKTHAMGAANSYGMRYLLKMIFAIAVGEEDEDGNDVGIVSDEQAAKIRTLIAKYGDRAADCEASLLKRFKYASVEEIAAKDFQRIKTGLESKLK